MSEEHYFPSPLSALSLPCGDINTRLDHIVDAATKAVGEKDWSQLDEYDAAERKVKLLEKAEAPSDFKKSVDAHWAILNGADILNVRPGSMKAVTDRANALNYFVRQFEARHGTDAQFRIKADYLWRTRRGDMSYRHFSILAAIYSVIGSNTRPVLITRDMIRCRALGYKTPAVMEAELSSRTGGAKPLSDKQIRDDLERLQTWGYFARVNPARKSRRAYFSHRLTEEEMIAAVAEKEFHRKKLTAARPAAADKIQALVTEKLSLLSGPLLSGPQKPRRAKQGPDKGQTGATEGPVEGQTRATINRNTLNRNTSNRNTPNTKSVNDLALTGGTCGWCHSKVGAIRPEISPDQPICTECQSTHFSS